MVSQEKEINSFSSGCGKRVWAVEGVKLGSEKKEKNRESREKKKNNEAPGEKGGTKRVRDVLGIL